MLSKREQCIFSFTSFLLSYSPSFPLLLKTWTPPPPQGTVSSGMTCLCGAEHTAMPLNHPLGSQSRGGLSLGPVQKSPVCKEAKPSLRRSEGCLQNNSLLSAVCFPEESPLQTDNSFQIGARVRRSIIRYILLWEEEVEDKSRYSTVSGEIICFGGYNCIKNTQCSR